MQSETQQAQWPNFNGFSFPSQSDAVSLSSPHLRRPTLLSEDAIACIQRILEQDDPETPLSTLHGLSAYYTKASELAAILKEDSPSLSFNPTFPGQDEYTPQQHPFLQYYAQPPAEDVEVVASLIARPNRVLLLNSLKSSQSLDGMPSKVLDVGLFRSLLRMPSAAPEQAKTEVSDVDTHLQYGDAKHDASKRMTHILKPRKDLSFGKPRLCKYSSMSISKPSYYDEYLEMSLNTTGLPMCIQLHDMLLQCAHAVGLNNTGSAVAIACKLKQQTSPYGSAAERIAYYFVKGLHARFEGTGWSLYMGHLSQHRPSSRQILEACLKYMSNCPFAKASHFLANQTILRVAKGASTLHIMDYQMTGIQYPSLFKELALLPGGPPKVRLIGMISPHYPWLSAQRDFIYRTLEKTGQRLSKCAGSLKVPFQFIPWVGMRENLRVQDFVSSDRGRDELFVVISTCFLRFDILDPRHLRIRILNMMNDVKPDVYIQGIVSGAYGNPLYSARFKEALFHFECVYDVLDTFTKRDDQDRLVFESEVLGKAILNVVACEGLLVSGRVENYKQWQATTKEAGIQQLSIDKDMMQKVQKLLQSWHKNYVVVEDRQCLLMGWKGRILYALSAWKSPARLG